MCRKLRAAAASVLRSAGHLELTGPPHRSRQPCNFGSALLQRWAPMVHSICLDRDSLPYPGLPAFLGSASRLQRLELRCFDQLAAAQADDILPSCTTGVSLAFAGTHPPSSFPPAMHSLEARFQDARSGSVPPLAPSALLYKLARMDLEHLETLSLVWDQAGSLQDPHVKLDCPKALRRLNVSITIDLADNTIMDLCWLRHQPCHTLAVRVDILTDLRTQHVKLLDQLRQILVHDLAVTWRYECPQELQQLWQQLTIRDSVVLCFKHTIFSKSSPLQFLPKCPKLTILAYLAHLYSPRLYIDWTAVSNQASRFSIAVSGAVSLAFVGSQVAMPDIQGPWQLGVYSVVGECGLEDPHMRNAQTANGRCVQFMQNAAALAAGWTVDVD